MPETGTLEPSVRDKPYTHFPGEPVRPLRHLSKTWYFTLDSNFQATSKASLVRNFFKVRFRAARRRERSAVGYSLSGARSTTPAPLRKPGLQLHCFSRLRRGSFHRERLRACGTCPPLSRVAPSALRTPHRARLRLGSNPRYGINRTLTFQASPFDHSGTSPLTWHFTFQKHAFSVYFKGESEQLIMPLVRFSSRAAGRKKRLGHSSSGARSTTPAPLH